MTRDMLKDAAAYLADTARHIAAGAVLVTEDIYQHRRDTCNKCPHRNPVTDSCNQCGCPLHATLAGDKLRRATSRCPLKLWDEQEEQKP